MFEISMFYSNNVHLDIQIRAGYSGMGWENQAFGQLLDVCCLLCIISWRLAWWGRCYFNLGPKVKRKLRGVQQLAQGPLLNQVSSVSLPGVRSVFSTVVCTTLRARAACKVNGSPLGLVRGVEGIGSAVQLQKKERLGARRNWRTCLEFIGSCLDASEKWDRFWQIFQSLGTQRPGLPAAAFSSFSLEAKGPGLSSPCTPPKPSLNLSNYPLLGL